MQIKTIRSALITNYEVLRLLEESQEAQKEIQKQDPTVEYPEHLRTVQFEARSTQTLSIKHKRLTCLYEIAH